MGHLTKKKGSTVLATSDSLPAPKEIKARHENMVFWSYFNGFYETLLGSVFTEINDKGRVFVPPYNAWVKPVLVLPLSAGRKLVDKINDIEDEFFDKKDNLIKEYNNKIAELLK